MGAKHVHRLSTVVLADFLVYAVMQLPTGVLVDRIGPRRTAAVGAATMNAGALALLPVVGDPPLVVVAVVFFVAGALLGTFVLTDLLVKERYSSRASGISMGAINGASFFGAAAFPTLMGWALDAYWTGEFVGGVRVYTVTEYRVAFGIAAVAGLVTVGCAGWIHRRAATAGRSAPGEPQREA